MYQTPSQGQGVEVHVQTSSTHSVMRVGLVERPIPSALLSKPSTTAAPHTTMLPETAARPVSMTMLAFLQLRGGIPGRLLQILLWTTLPENRAAQTCDGHCGPIVREGCDLTFAWREYSGFYTLSSRGNPSFSTQGEACPSQIEGVRCEPGTDILVYPLSDLKVFGDLRGDHNLDQLFGVGALAHRGLHLFIGGLCGDHSPHRTTMT